MIIQASLRIRLIRAIQLGLLVLAILMPFHAFLSVSLGHLTGHQALIQAWKEVLLLILSVAGLTLVVGDPDTRHRLHSLPVILASTFAGIALLITAIHRPDLTAVAFGAKTDLEFLVAFILAALVTTPRLIRQLTIITLASSSLVVGFGLLQITILPPDFLTHFGYGPGTIPPYLVLDPAVSSLRFASTLGGPNQLGTYLILPLALSLVLIIRRHAWQWLPLLLGSIIVSINTYSRSAWLGALVALASIALILIPSKFRIRATALLTGIAILITIFINKLLKISNDLQYYIFHSSARWHTERGSDYEHLVSLRTGLSSALREPFGHGLGTAGPATLHTSTNHIIENNYLQIAYETSLAGAMVFIGFFASVLTKLIQAARTYDLAAATAAAILGISIAAIFLPAWTDSTTALTVMIAAGSIIGLPKARI